MGLTKEKDVFIKEIEHIHNCTLSSKIYTQLDLFWNILKINKKQKKINRLLTQDTRKIISKFKGTDFALLSPTQLTYMSDQVTGALQKTNPDYTLLFPDL